MIKEYICEKIDVVTIYCKVQTYFLNDLNNCKTWWSSWWYIEYELTIPFQLQLNFLTHVISQKTSRQDYYSFLVDCCMPINKMISC
jgi:hypothetical protein